MRYNTGSPPSPPSPTLVGAKLVGAGLGSESRGPASIVSAGINSGPLAISGFGALGDDLGMGTTDTSSDASASDSSAPSWLTSLIGAGTQIENVVAQQQLNTINIQRASQGLAPLPSSVIGPTATVGLSPDVQNLLIYGGIAFAALFLFNTAMKRR